MTDEQRQSLLKQADLFDEAASRLRRHAQDLRISLDPTVWDHGAVDCLNARAMRREAIVGLARHASYAAQQATLTALSTE